MTELAGGFIAVWETVSEGAKLVCSDVTVVETVREIVLRVSLITVAETFLEILLK